jgi:hypothetical protein
MQGLILNSDFKTMETSKKGQRSLSEGSDNVPKSTGRKRMFRQVIDDNLLGSTPLSKEAEKAEVSGEFRYQGKLKVSTGILKSSPANPKEHLAEPCSSARASLPSLGMTRRRGISSTQKLIILTKKKTK